MGNATPWLSLAIWIPIAFGGLILAAGRDRNAGVVRTVALMWWIRALYLFGVSPERLVRLYRDAR